MSSLAAIFLHSKTPSITKQSWYALSRLTTRLEPNWQPTWQDDFARVDLRAALLLLRAAAARVAKEETQWTDEAQWAAYLDEIDQHLQRAKSRGYPPVLTVPLDADANASLGRYASALSLQTIWAEAFLAATAWAAQDRSKAIEYLGSAYVKARAVASVRRAAFVAANEKETVRIDQSDWKVKIWTYSGQRPVEGSAARLAQDVEFAWAVAQGRKVTPGEIFDKWLQIVDASSPLR